MPIKRGTTVEFIGTDLTPEGSPPHPIAVQAAASCKKRVLKKFFDKYGLQPGDRGKIWQGYRGSWIRITWTLQDGTKVHSVPMRSGNFKIVDKDMVNSDNETISELESDDSIPELESDDSIPKLESDDSIPKLKPELAAALVELVHQNPNVLPANTYNLVESLNRDLKKTREENVELKAALSLSLKPVVEVQNSDSLVKSLRDALEQTRKENEDLKESLTVWKQQALCSEDIPELQPELAAALDERFGPRDIVSDQQDDKVLRLREALLEEVREHDKLKLLCEESKEEIMGLHELATMRAVKIEELKEKNLSLINENTRLQLSHELTLQEMDCITGPNTTPCEWETEKIKELEATFKTYQNELMEYDSCCSQTTAMDSDYVNTQTHEICDTWAREQIKELTNAIGNQALICDAQQKVIQNLKTKLDVVELEEMKTNRFAQNLKAMIDEVNLHESQTNELAGACFNCLKINGMIVDQDDNHLIVDKDEQDKACQVLEEVAKEYLTKKHIKKQWVVPEIGSG